MWGGQNYNLTKCGRLRNGITIYKNSLYMDTFNCCKCVQIYKGLEFPEWNNHILVTLKDQTLRKLNF